MSTYFDIPTQFRPVLRLSSTAHGVDREAYITEVVQVLYAHRDDAGSADLAAQIAGQTPWPVLDADTALAASDEAVAAALTSLSNHVDESARRYFSGLDDPIVSSITTCLASAVDGLPPMTVVWIRTGQRGEVQFAFPLLGIDVDTAEVEHRSLVQSDPTPHHARGTVMPMALTPKKVIESATEVASSVSWALPPPWNVAVTAGLSVLQMILHATDAPEGPSPLEQLKTDLQDFIGEQQLVDISGNYAEFAHQLGDRTGDMSFAPADIDSVGRQYLEDFQQYVLHDSTGALRISDNVTHLMGRLQGVSTALANENDPSKFDEHLKASKEALDLLCTGVTLWMTGMKAVMQVRACAVAKELTNQDVSRYLDDNHSWWSTFHSIRNSILGIEVDGKVIDRGWASELATWIDEMRTTRLAYIGPTEEAVKKSWASGTTSGGLMYGYDVDDHGYRFVDKAEADEWKHFRKDTMEGGDACHAATTTPHKAEVDVDRAAHIQQVQATLDSVLGGATTSIETWKAKLTDFEQLAHLPGPSSAPKVTVMKSGTPTPQGAWVEGARVEYSVMYVNDKGPSDGGPWSAPMDVGGFAFATVSDIPQCVEASPKKLWVARRVTAPDGAQSVRTVRILDPGTSTTEDTRP